MCEFNIFYQSFDFVILFGDCKKKCCSSTQLFLFLPIPALFDGYRFRGLAGRPWAAVHARDRGSPWVARFDGPGAAFARRGSPFGCEVIRVGTVVNVLREPEPLHGSVLFREKRVFQGV